jgi:hypothetical protein
MAYLGPLDDELRVRGFAAVYLAERFRMNRCPAPALPLAAPGLAASR